MPDYRFTSDWFSMHTPNWQQHVMPLLAGRSGLRYLEVGVFEGRSLLWVLENVLTADDARATAVDAFFHHAPPDYEWTFRANLALNPDRAKVDVIKGNSAEVLRTLPLASYDLIYIDGGHATLPLMIDLALTWGLLRADGVLVLDDYRKHYGQMPRELVPKTVIDLFLHAARHEIAIVDAGYQMIVRRLMSPEAHRSEQLPFHDRDFVSELGDWLYVWESRTLVRVDGTDRMFLPDAVRKRLEQALRSGVGGHRTIGRVLTLWRRFNRA